MEGTLNTIRNLFTTYGFKVAMIILGIVVIVNFVKRPIKKWALAWADKNGVDKAAVTKWFVLLPVAVSFILTATVELVIAKFDFSLIDWGTLNTSALVYASIAVYTYETGTLQLKDLVSRALKKLRDKLNEVIDAEALKKEQIPENKQVQLPQKAPETKEDTL